MKEKKHGLSDTQAATLLDLLRDCANAPPNYNFPDEPSDPQYQHAVNQLKAADVWIGNEQWLANKWLCYPKVSNEQCHWYFDKTVAVWKPCNYNCSKCYIIYMYNYTCTLLAHRPIHNMYIVYATKVYTFMYNICI